MNQIEWIPVEDGLPDIDQNVLAYYVCSGLTGAGTRVDVRQALVSHLEANGSWKFILGKVTHWLALPDFPTDGGGQ